MPEESSHEDEGSIEGELDRVRDEVRSRPPSGGLAPEEARKLRLEARDQAERYWGVTAERAFVRAPGSTEHARALAAAPVKYVVRRLVRWYVEPALAEQRYFNAALLRLVDDLDVRMAALEERSRS